MNLIKRLKELEARIYAADAHEAHKYAGQFQDALYVAWPKLLDRLEALEAVGKVAEEYVYVMVGWCEVHDVAVGPRFSELKDTVDALAALEGDTNELG